MAAGVQTGEERLEELCLRCTQISEKGFAIDLRSETARWHELVRSLGRRRAYRLAGDLLCAEYARRYGKDYLFSNGCVAFEIAYHADAYFWACGYGRHGRHPSTLLFTREKLARHCEVIDISTDDAAVWKQCVMFGYAAGVRPSYRRTDQDPFDRRLFRFCRLKAPEGNRSLDGKSDER